MPIVRQVFALAALGALLGLAWRSVACTRADRRAAQARAQPDHLQTWEGEGGGVPVGTHRTAAQVTPAAGPGDVPSPERGLGSPGVRPA